MASKGLARLNFEMSSPRLLKTLGGYRGFGSLEFCLVVSILCSVLILSAGTDIPIPLQLRHVPAGSPEVGRYDLGVYTLTPLFAIAASLRGLILSARAATHRRIRGTFRIAMRGYFVWQILMGIGLLVIAHVD